MINRMVIAGVVVGVVLSACAHAKPPAVVADVAVVQPSVAPKVAVPESSSPAPVAPAVDVVEALKGTVLFFDFDSDHLTPASQSTLQRVGDLLRKDGRVRLQIEGNCDEVGTEEYNMMLGQRRAEVAREYLTNLGVTSRQLDTISYGSLRPVNSAHTQDAWAQNRRDALEPSVQARSP